MQGRGGEADERRELGEEGDRRGTAPDVTRAGAIHQFPHQGDNHKRNFFPKFFFFLIELNLMTLIDVEKVRVVTSLHSNRILMFFFF